MNWEKIGGRMLLEKSGERMIEPQRHRARRGIFFTLSIFSLCSLRLCGSKNTLTLSYLNVLFHKGRGYYAY